MKIKIEPSAQVKRIMVRTVKALAKREHKPTRKTTLIEKLAMDESNKEIREYNAGLRDRIITECVRLFLKDKNAVVA